MECYESFTRLTSRKKNENENISYYFRISVVAGERKKKAIHTHHEIIRLNAKQIAKITKSNWRINLELELAIVMSWSYTRSIGRKCDCFHLVKVHHEQVTLGLRR